MLKISHLKSIIHILEKNDIRYYVFGGIALDGLRSKLTRDHSDLDLFIVTQDLKKLWNLMELNKYECIKRESMYFFEYKTIKIGVVELIIENRNFIAKGNKTLEIYPLELFFKENYGKIKAIRFRIVPNEVLVFESQFSKYAEDKEFGSKLEHNKKSFEQIKFEKIRDSRKK